MSLGIARPLVACFADQADRLVDLATLQQDETEIVKGIKVIAVLPQHPSIERLGLVEQTLLLERGRRLKRLQRCGVRGVRSDGNVMTRKDGLFVFSDHLFATYRRHLEMFV